MCRFMVSTSTMTEDKSDKQNDDDPSEFSLQGFREIPGETDSDCPHLLRVIMPSRLRPSDFGDIHRDVV